VCGLSEVGGVVRRGYSSPVTETREGGCLVIAGTQKSNEQGAKERCELAAIELSGGHKGEGWP
jgi:hypothetical protein